MTRLYPCFQPGIIDFEFITQTELASQTQNKQPRFSANDQTELNEVQPELHAGRYMPLKVLSISASYHFKNVH